MPRLKLTGRTTPELREGDLILNHGMKLRLVRETFRRPCCEGHERGPEYGHCRPEDGHGETVAFIGVLTNADDPELDPWILNHARGDRAHRARNNQWLPEGDEPIWTVQGNALAHWSVIDET